MLPELHQVLQDLIYEKGRIDRADVDVAFDAPTKEWVDKLVRPTVDLFLFELVENMDLRQAQLQTRNVNGHAEFRAPPRRIDLRYVVTAATTNVEDAHRLLWRTLGVLMREPELEADLFPEDVRIEAPIVTRVAEPDSGIKLLDVWSALGTEPRPAFTYVVTLPLDLAIQFEAPFAMTRTLGFRHLRSQDRLVSRTFISGVVRDKLGASLADVTVALAAQPAAWTRTDARGAFTLQTPEQGRVEVLVTRAGGAQRTLTIEVPSSIYELQLD